MAQFDLTSIVQTPHIFRDRDGRAYEVPTAAMFSTLEIAKVTRLQHALPEAMKALGEKDGDQAAAVTALDQVVNEYFQMLVPSLSPERIQSIAIAEKAAFIQWWQREETPKDAPPPNRTAGKRVSRGKRSPASSGSTGLTPSAS